MYDYKTKIIARAQANLLKMFLLLLILQYISYCSTGNRTYLAQVNGQPVTIEDFRMELRISGLDKTTLPSSPQDPKFFEAKKVLLNDMINDIILVSEARKNNINVSDEELSREIASFADDYPGESLNKYLTAKGISLALWKEKIKNSMLIKKLTALVTKDTPSIDENEIADYYEKNKNSYVEPEMIHAYQIVVKTEEEAYKILSELRSGKKFENLAEMYSITPEGKQGGDLGYFSRGSMPGPFENTIFSLAQGRISKPVSSEYGYHIFKVTDKKKSRLKPLPEVRDEIVSELIRIKKSSVFSEWFKDKIAKAEIKRNNALLAGIK
jgi:peptidyl-prolyl cis-trans isomerase C